MGVQLGVAGARAAMGEGCRYEPLGRDRTLAASSAPGAEHLLFDGGYGLVYGAVMRAGDCC
jgi:hypothetical protein